MEPQEIPRLKPLEGWRACESGERVVFADVRGPGRFAERRIAGAVHCFLKEVEGRLPDLPADALLVFY